MSEQKQENKVQELLDWLEDEKGDVASIWGMDDTLDTPEDRKTLETVFSKDQIRFVRILVKNVIKVLEFHDKEALAESHMDIRKDINKMEAKLRNHRHPLNEQYSAKPEF